MAGTALAVEHIALLLGQHPAGLLVEGILELELFTQDIELELAIAFRQTKAVVLRRVELHGAFEVVLLFFGEIQPRGSERRPDLVRGDDGVRE